MAWKTAPIGRGTNFLSTIYLLLKFLLSEKGLATMFSDPICLTYMGLIANSQRHTRRWTGKTLVNLFILFLTIFLLSLLSSWVGERRQDPDAYTRDRTKAKLKVSFIKKDETRLFYDHENKKRNRTNQNLLRGDVDRKTQGSKWPIWYKVNF